MGFIDRQVTVKDCAVSYREAGSGATVLYLHGAGGVESSLPFLERLAATHHVIAPDHPGFGRTVDPDWLDNIHDLAYAYLDFLDALKLRELHVVGTSLGGWLAMEIAIRNASRIKSLTLAAPAGLRPGDVLTGDLFMWSPEERVRKTIADPALAEKILALPKTPEQQEIALRNWFTTAKLGWEPRWFDPHLDKWLHRLTMPVHLIWGDSDQLFPLAYGRKFHAAIPHARLSVLERCGHLPFLEHPDRMLQLVGESAR